MYSLQCGKSLPGPHEPVPSTGTVAMRAWGGGGVLFKPQGCMKIMGFAKKEASCWKKWPIWFGFNLQESSLDKTLNAEEVWRSWGTGGFRLGRLASVNGR